MRGTSWDRPPRAEAEVLRRAEIVRGERPLQEHKQQKQPRPRVYPKLAP